MIAENMKKVLDMFEMKKKLVEYNIKKFRLSRISFSSDKHHNFSRIGKSN